MRYPLWLLTFVLAVVPSSLAAPVDDRKLSEDAAEQKVRLKLNAIEIAKLLEHYDGLVKRELRLQDSVRACNKSGDPRLAQYQQALKETQEDLEKTKRKLVDLELERAKLVERLGKKAADDAALESFERLNRTLETILQRLDKLEKRLEKTEGQKR